MLARKSVGSFEQPICADTWRDKYRYKDEPDYAATCERVVAALTKNESTRFQDEALRAMTAREIIPAGRILTGAGTDKRVTLINCFVSPYIQDSMATEPGHPGSGIMDALSKAAYTLQMGGGIGMDFSTIRPRGAAVKRTASTSSGIIPFMDMWHYMSETIMSAGHRRGAMMGTLRCDHPDIEEFIEAKQRSGRLTNFNVSVLVTSKFMQAVERGEQWNLVFPSKAAGISGGGLEEIEGEGFVYKRVSARELWNKIIGATYVHAEPGVIFIDRINELNNLAYCESIHCVNPCGEQALPDNGDCNLGHTNLAVMVDRPFEVGAALNFSKLEAAARTMVRLLDNVLDVTLWPTQEQKAEALAKRRIGLGFTGLASALQQLNISYGSPHAIELTRRITKCQAVAAYQESCRLAKERGAFPLFDPDKFCAAPFVRKLDRDVKAEVSIREYGIRNGVLLSIAPTGTTSLVVGNVSSGIEPVFAHRYRRKVRGGSGELEHEYSVYDYGYLKYCEHVGVDPEAAETEDGSILPPSFVTADQLSVEQHLQMAAAAQEWIDSAISKTINCPTSMTLDAFRDVYTRAYALGMKGCTTYRPDPRSGRGAVLETEPVRTEAEEASHVVSGASAQPDNSNKTVGRADTQAVADESTSRDAPPPTDQVLALAQDKIPMQDVVEGRRYRIKWPSEDCAYYVIITDCQDSAGRRRPFELFISTKSERHSEWVKAFSLLVTAIFRREGDPSFVVDELRSVFAATGGTWIKVPWAGKPKLATSLVAAIGLKIEEHLRWLGMISDDEPIMQNVDQAALMPAAELLDVCLHCGAKAVVYSEGCATCHACGKSDCG